MSFRPCALIPTYNHVDALDGILRYLREFGLPVIVIDDGNAPGPASRIAGICTRHEGVELHREPANGGKGAAVLAGLALAAERGFSHAVQIDADGQHDIERLGEMLKLAERQPDALVTGAPLYDDTMPLARRIGRWITHLWVSINTHSFRVIDSMCGFRVYPVARTIDVAHSAQVARRMGFDTEILVRMSWSGTPIVTLPVSVTYPPGNHSNFEVWRDNVEISHMHARLFFGMLRRAPGWIFARKQPEQRETPRHWASMRERGSKLGLWLLAIVFRIFGRNVCLAVMSPVVLFFFLTGGEQRRASLDYLGRARDAGLISDRVGWRLSFRHFSTFAAAALDRLAAWTGSYEPADIEDLDKANFVSAKQADRGAVLLTAHYGNPEVVRAIANLNNRLRLIVLMHTAHAEAYTGLVDAISGSSAIRIIQVSQIGPDTAIILQNAIDNGEWIVVSADRGPVSGKTSRVSWANFLGKRAPFPQGPHILAGILKCPVHILFCVRVHGRYRVIFEPFADRIELPRANRERAIQASVERFATRLETHLRIAPLQWFNFFDFWRPGGMEPPADVARRPMEAEFAS
nr:glycosyltransferase family 2 protein [Aerococcus urinae]